jgi:transposase InsO family protein
VDEQRAEFLRAFKAEGANKRQVCREWGVSPKTAYKWQGRYDKKGAAGLMDQSRRPQHSPRQTGPEIEAQVLAIRSAQPAWGARKIAALLREQGVAEVPALSTITRILERNGSLRKAGLRPRAVGRFEREAPNELWQMDFKGHFALKDGTRCHPLLLVDDHSRYCLAARACANEQGQTVRTELESVFREHGLPEAMLMDNGSPWGNDRVHVYTPLVAWLMRYDIRVLHGRPRHPQTQGKLERLNRTLDEEFLQPQGEALESLAHTQPGLERWRSVYNHVRPHEALQMQVPASRYRPSSRAMPERVPPIEYEEADLVRRVQQGGRISYGGREWALPKAFRGYPVALRPTEGNEQVAAYFCRQRIAVLDLPSGSVQVVTG